ncbi:MAG: sulfatase-like hydrolase/transferase [Methyloceanibacter sp.]
MLLACKFVLLAVFLLGTNLGVYQRVKMIGWQPGLVVFAFVWILACATILLIAFAPRHRVRLFWTLPLVVCSFVAFSYQLITAKFMGLADFEKLIGLAGFVDNVTGFFGDKLVSAALWCLAGAVAINMPPYARRAGGFRRVAWATEFAGVLQLIPIMAIGSILYTRGGEGSDGMPVQYNGLAFLVVTGVDAALQGPPQARSPVRLAHGGAAPIRSIVVIMDESIRGDLLDINLPNGVDTGLKNADSALFNFGVSSSIANCSDSTNLGFRYGVTKARYLREIHTNPSIWSYAKKAGYRTVYIDGQRHSGRLQSHMTSEEVREIDEFIQLDTQLKPFEKDPYIARLLAKMLRTANSPQFVFINKMGAHFPYEGKYPRDQVVYQPTMSLSYLGNESDPTNLARPADDATETRLRFKNSYLNSIRWNIGEFFRIVLPAMNLANTVLVFTADHGQDFHDDGRPGYRTHCTHGPAVADEGIVPLVVLTSIPAVATQLRSGVAMNYNRASQFNVFPTLLALMGYERESLRNSDAFEPTLFAELPDDNQRFLSTFFVRLGKKPVWNRIVQRGPQ